MAKLIKAIQHVFTQDQLNELETRYNIAGEDVIELRDLNPQLWELVINTPGDEALIGSIVDKLSEIISSKADEIMGGGEDVYILLPVGSPAFMYLFTLSVHKIQQSLNEKYFRQKRFNVLFAHSERVSEETKNPDGTVTKKTVFKHVKFLEF